jgi:hypothetical protein
MTSRIVLAAAAAMALMTTAAQADVTDYVSMTFANGGSFKGDVTFADGYTSVVGVDGTLYGYEYGYTGYVGGAATDTLDWVWQNGYNFSTGKDNYSTFLMDGPGSGYTSTGPFYNFVQLAYNYSSAPDLRLTIGDSVYGTDNYVDYTGVVKSSSIPLPEPSTWAMTILGLLGIGAVLRAQYRQNRKLEALRAS